MSDGNVREILVVPHTHHDVGYTDTPRIAEQLHRVSLERALALVEAPTGNERSRFRWTVEVARPLDRWLAAEPATAARVVAAVRGGNLAVCGGYLNMTQLVDDGGYDRSFRAVERIRALGIPIRAVQHGDVNGVGWGVVPAMRRAGLDTLVMALNPDHGRPPFEQPSVFWWQGPDDSRVLVALHNHYAVGWDWGIVRGAAPDDGPVGEFVNRLNERTDYPFDFAVVHAAMDNCAPTGDLCHAVDAWNDKHPELPMRTATTNDVVDRWWNGPIDSLPTYRGEWADWWAHGHGSTAREVATAREAARLRRSAMSILAGARLEGTEDAPSGSMAEWYGPPVLPGDSNAIEALTAELDEQLLLFQEHTWGARESVVHPTSVFTRTHWNQKAAMAWRAQDLAHDLARHAGARSLHPERTRVDDAVAVVNASPQPARQMTIAEVEGETIRFWLDCPPHTTALAHICRPVWREVEPGAVHRLQDYEVVVDPTEGGILSLRHVGSGRELVDPAAEFPLVAIVHEHVAPGSEHPVATTSRRHFHPDTPGPEFVRRAARSSGKAEIASDGDGAWSAVRWNVEIADLLTARVELIVSGSTAQLVVSLDRRPRVEPEGVFVTFPFAVKRPRFWLQTTDAVYEAEREQLPDTCRDWYSIQHAVGVADEDASGIMWGTLDAPLVQVGGFHTGEWARHLDASVGHVNSWLMNNLYFTNFKASQGGTDQYRYMFQPSDVVSRAGTARFGERLGQPPLVFGWEGWGGAHALPHLELPSDWQLGDLRLAPDGVVAVIRSLSSEPTTGFICWSGRPIVGHVSGQGPSPLGEGAGIRLQLAPYEQVVVHLNHVEGSNRR